MAEKMTIQKIADELGLHRKTVSWVLNNQQKERSLSAATVKRVKDYVAQIGFHPNIGALAMKGKYSKDIGVITASTPYLAHRRSFFAISEYLDRQNISSVPFALTADNCAELVQRINLFGIRRLIIIASDFYGPDEMKTFKMFRELIADDMQCYIYDARKNLLDTIDFEKYGDVVCATERENYDAMLVDILKKSGYRKIITKSAHATEELRQLAKNADIEVEAHEFYRSRYPNIEQMFYEKQVLEYGEKVAGEFFDYDFKSKKCVFSIRCDYIGAGFLRRMLDKGFKVPGDFGIVCWDNLPEAKYFALPLTSYGPPHGKFIEHCRKWIDGKNTESHIKKFKIELSKGKTL